MLPGSLAPPVPGKNFFRYWWIVGWMLGFSPLTGCCTFLLLAGWSPGLVTWEVWSHVGLLGLAVRHLFLLVPWASSTVRGTPLMVMLVLGGGCCVAGWVTVGPICLEDGSLLAPWDPPWYSLSLTLAPISIVSLGILAPPILPWSSA